MATYLDSYGGGQTYRKSPYTTIGSTKLQLPTRINMDSMYGSSQGLPQTPAVPQYNVPTPTASRDVTGEQFNLETAFGDAFSKRTLYGKDYYMPTAAEQGQTYENEAGKWEYKNGQWVKITDPSQAYRQSIRDVYDIASKYYGGKPWTEQYGAVAPEQLSQEAITSWTNQFQNSVTVAQQEYNATLAEYNSIGWTEKERDRKDEARKRMVEAQQMLDRAKNKQSEFERAVNQYNRQQGLLGQYNQQADILSPQKQFENVLTGLQNDEISILNDDGIFDPTDLIAQGPAGQWLADVIQKSYETGNIMGDFFQTDENGMIVRDENNNPVYTEELQTMMDYFSQGSEEDRRAWQEYQRELGAHALATGHSLDSGYYSEVVGGAIAERALAASQQVAEAITNEITSQYQYISNSLQGMLTQMGYLTNDTQFIQDMNLQYEAIMQNYQQQIEELRQKIEEGQAARSGDIFSAIFGGLTNLALSFL